MNETFSGSKNESQENNFRRITGLLESKGILNGPNAEVPEGIASELSTMVKTMDGAAVSRVNKTLKEIIDSNLAIEGGLATLIGIYRESERARGEISGFRTGK